MSEFDITYGDGSVLPVSVTITAPEHPPTNQLKTHQVKFGTNRHAQAVVTLTPGTLQSAPKPPPVPDPTPTPTPTPTGGPVAPVKVGALLFDQLTNPQGTDIGASWSRGWFGGENFNGFALDDRQITVSGGVVTLGCGKTGPPGVFMTTMPGRSADGKGFEFTLGYTEAELFIPGDGTRIAGWPTWWWNTDGGPEIDVIEGGDSLSHPFTSNYHIGGQAINHDNIPGHFTAGWHTFGMLVENGKNTLFCDGVSPLPTYYAPGNDAPKYGLLTNGSNSGGAPFLARSVRVWALG